MLSSKIFQTTGTIKKTMTPKERNELLIRMDERLMQMARTQEDILRETKTTNGRVTALEKWKSKISGGMIAISIISTLIGAIVSIVIDKFL